MIRFNYITREQREHKGTDIMGLEPRFWYVDKAGRREIPEN